MVMLTKMGPIAIQKSYTLSTVLDRILQLREDCKGVYLKPNFKFHLYLLVYFERLMNVIIRNTSETV